MIPTTRRLWWWWRGVWRRYAGYIVLCVILGLALGAAFHVQSRNVAKDRERDSLALLRDGLSQARTLLAECVASRTAILDNRSLLRALIDRPSTPIPIPPGADPALVDLINGANARAETNRAEVLGAIDSRPVAGCDKAQRHLHASAREVRLAERELDDG